MDTAIDLAVTAAWLVPLGGLLAYRVFEVWRRGGEPLPFFNLLERCGLSVAQAQQVAGGETLAVALRRCELCSDRKACARALAVDWLGRGPLACGPNAEFFKQVGGARARG